MRSTMQSFLDAAEDEDNLDNFVILDIPTIDEIEVASLAIEYSEQINEKGMTRQSFADPAGDEGNPDDFELLDISTTDEIEVAWLAIEYLEQFKGNEEWQRPTIKRILPKNGSTILHFETSYARILPPQEETANAKRYVIYELSVRLDSLTIDPNPAKVERRYTDFLNLYTNLKMDHADAMSTVSFPRKVLLGNFSPDLIAERCLAFEVFLDHIVSKPVLRHSQHFVNFLQDIELKQACQLLDERRYESAIPLLENCFRLLNKIFTDRSQPVLLVLCRLVVACTTSPVQPPSANHWAALALRRYETVCDTDLLQLYIPLLHTCVHLWWYRESDQRLLLNRLRDMSRKGINVSNSTTLMTAIHLLDPRSETI